MVSLSKSPLPKDATIKSEHDYREGEVFETLVRDCYGKCYICEDKPTAINVEHIIPHKGNLTLKYDWNNLLLSCVHCNNIKYMNYEGILNPTQCDPEEHIALSVWATDNLTDRVHVESISDDDSTRQTAELLELVYNGGSTEIKKEESVNLLNERLMPNIRRFFQYIKNYHEEPDLGYADVIKKEISRSSAFAAFKRKIIRDDPKLSRVFADALR